MNYATRVTEWEQEFIASIKIFARFINASFATSHPFVLVNTFINSAQRVIHKFEWLRILVFLKMSMKMLRKNYGYGIAVSMTWILSIHFEITLLFDLLSLFWYKSKWNRNSGMILKHKILVLHNSDLGKINYSERLADI